MKPFKGLTDKDIIRRLKDRIATYKRLEEYNRIDLDNLNNAVNNFYKFLVEEDLVDRYLNYKNK